MVIETAHKEHVATDYSWKLRSAEEAVVSVLDDILTEGGHMLWQKYLQRKAFPFAAETASDALVSYLQMCFVAHDHGETACDEDWSLEDEPQPGEVDSWARMHLALRTKKPQEETDKRDRTRTAGTMRFQGQRTRVSDARARGAKTQGRGAQSESRTFGIQEEMPLDDEEEKLRDARQQEETRRRDRENRLKQNERAKEEEQRRVQVLHEEMSRRQHTFDSEGGLIWVEELKLEKMPKVQEVFPYFIKRDPRAKKDDPDGTMGSTKASQQGNQKGKQSRRKLRFDKTKKEEDDFPDGFSKLQHGQPPILETMVVKPGVVLDSNGKSKPGPAVANTGAGMSRKEYVALTEREVAYEAQFSQLTDSKGDHSGTEDGGSPGGPPGSRGHPLGGDGSPDGEGLDGTLPPIAGARGGSRAGLGGSRGQSQKGGADAKGDGDASKKGEVQMAPPAPPMHARAKKMEAVGHLGRPPRLHVAPLGGPYGFGVAQPPLGATMGHGLVRHGSVKDDFFFPRPIPQMPDLLRATSDSSIAPRTPPRSGRRNYRSVEDSQRTQSREALSSSTETGMLGQEDSMMHGHIKTEKKSQAYRGMRQTLFPNTLSSGYVSGMI